MNINYVIAGAGGRMGRRIIAVASQDPRFRLVGALEAGYSELLGRDAGELAGIGALNVPVTHAPPASFDVLIDFSSPDGTHRAMGYCWEAERPIVIGTTGHDEEAQRKIRACTSNLAVLKAANMSVGVNLLLRLVREASQRLDASYDVEIVETHHRHKVDAPSGTALALRQAVEEGRVAGGIPSGETIHGRSGITGPRSAGQVGIHALRQGEVVGRHVVSFGSPGETISIEHTAHSRDTFAAGALFAAAWIIGKPPGFYSMSDVLG